MIDADKLQQLVEEQIQKTVQQEIKEAVSQVEWIQDLEKQIIEFVQARIMAKFKNVSVLPEIIEVINTSVQELFSKGTLPVDLEKYVDQDSVIRAINSKVDLMIEKTIDDLTVDPTWLARVETLITQNYVQKVSRHLSSVDINNMVIDYIDNSVERWQERFKQNFKTNGILDTATSKQLSIDDELVVVNNQLVSHGLQVATNAEVSGSLTANDLVVKGTINVDNKSWDVLKDSVANKVLTSIDTDWQKSLVTQVLEIAKTKGIQFESVLIQGQPLINGSQLNSVVTQSNLTKVGNLESLVVDGHADFNKTLTVTARRVGVNTQQPEMALTVWDEEVAVLAGKISKDRAFVGTSRKQTLSLGTNRTAQMDIDPDGLVTVKALRIDRWKIGYANEVPGYSGTRGDIVFNSDPKPETPFAWICLGGHRWQTLKGV